MSYSIYQKSGKHVDQAREYTRLRLEFGIEAAQAYYKSVTGTSPAPELSCWWVYNADAALQSRHSVTRSDIERYTGRPYSALSDRACATATCACASRKHGGEWDYYEEY